jgi:hypothetical protein
MTNIKHVGKLANTGKKVIVVFRELPDESDQCLVVDTDALPDWMHDDMMSAVEAPGAQASPNFYEYAQRTVFTDGTNMLQSLHSTGRLMKTPTDNVAMTPNNSVSVGLTEINNIVREEDGESAAVVAPPTDQVTLAGKDTSSTQTIVEDVTTKTDEKGLSDTDIAKNLLAQAKGYETEAKSLKAQAYDLAPGLKPGPKTTAKEEPQGKTVASFTAVSS